MRMLRLDRFFATLGFILGAGASACAPTAASQPTLPAGVPRQVTIAPPAGVEKPPFKFAPADGQLLDDVQRGCFLFFWNEGLGADRHGRGPDQRHHRERGGRGVPTFGPPDRGRARLGDQEGSDGARRAHPQEPPPTTPTIDATALFYHYLDPDDAGPHRGSHEHVISTIDSAILMAGDHHGGGVLRRRHQEDDRHARRRGGLARVRAGEEQEVLRGRGSSASGSGRGTRASRKGAASCSRTCGPTPGMSSAW